MTAKDGGRSEWLTEWLSDWLSDWLSKAGAKKSGKSRQHNKHITQLRTTENDKKSETNYSPAASHTKPKCEHQVFQLL